MNQEKEKEKEADDDAELFILTPPPPPYVTETIIPISALYKKNADEEELFFDVDIESGLGSKMHAYPLLGFVLHWSWRALNSTILGYFFLLALCCGAGCFVGLFFTSLYLKDMVLGGLDVDVAARQLAARFPL